MGAKLVVCIMPVWQQVCSFVLRLCGGEKEKEKKEKISSFVACVAVSLKLVVLYYACGRQACSLYYACVAASL